MLHHCLPRRTEAGQTANTVETDVWRAVARGGCTGDAVLQRIQYPEKALVSMNELTGIKAGQQRMWAAGDFSMVATSLVIVGELLCEAVDLHAGRTVLDVATGSGNTALSAARRWGTVTGIDFVPALLERGRERAAAERLQITFLEADAENIPFPDASFDVVLSTFGSMFAPSPEQAAREMLRVCRPGGQIGMAN
jgi:SAM-dependent methyltransferase